VEPEQEHRDGEDVDRRLRVQHRALAVVDLGRADARGRIAGLQRVEERDRPALGEDRSDVGERQQREGDRRDQRGRSRRAERTARSRGRQAGQPRRRLELRLAPAVGAESPSVRGLELRARLDDQSAAVAHASVVGHGPPCRLRARGRAQLEYE
jgi:hypothetical protein